ncbi:MAG: tyrosine-type recombinase/integrase, partial [Pseudomonadota bacterium]|nr:tyrosine-type recombinase/integrase [Pseudomonadota bacterium]
VRTKKVVRDRGGIRRKHHSNRVASQLTAHEAAARFAMEQITAIYEDSIIAAAELKEMLAARDALPEDKQRITPAFREFLVEVTVLDSRGDLVHGASQMLVFWAWRERDVWLSLEQDALRRQRGMRPRKARNKDAERTLAERALLDMALKIKLDDVRAHSEKYNDVVFEFRGCLPGVGGVTSEPRFLTLLHHSVDNAPSYLSARQQNKRHRLMQNWQVKPVNTMPADLLRFGFTKSVLLRWMNSRNRLMVPIEATYFATLLGTLAFDLYSETLGRASEAIQVEQDISRWSFDSPTGEPTVAALTAIKSTPNEPPASPIPIIVSEPLFDEIMRVADTIAIANGHTDRFLPRVDEPAGRPREADPDRVGEALPPRKRALVFQWNGQALTPGQVNDLVRWIMAHRGHVTSHLIRHGGANRLRELGLPERSIQAILHHRSPRMTAWYARRDAIQLRAAAAIATRNDRHSAAEKRARTAARARL